MPDCPNCGTHLNRLHRNVLEKLVYVDTFLCIKCHRRYRRRYPRVDAFIQIVFSRHTHCIRCGRAHVRRQRTRDRVDSLSRHPYSTLCRLTAAPRYKCDNCRLQYHDWRPLVPPA